MEAAEGFVVVIPKVEVSTLLITSSAPPEDAPSLPKFLESPPALPTVACPSSLEVTDGALSSGMVPAVIEAGGGSSVVSPSIGCSKGKVLSVDGSGEADNTLSMVVVVRPLGDDPSATLLREAAELQNLLFDSGSNLCFEIYSSTSGPLSISGSGLASGGVLQEGTSCSRARGSLRGSVLRTSLEDRARVFGGSFCTMVNIMNIQGLWIQPLLRDLFFHFRSALCFGLRSCFWRGSTRGY